jgi:hypothetical protein
LLVAVAAVVVVASWLLQLCSAATTITSNQPYYMSKFIVIEYVISNFRFFFKDIESIRQWPAGLPSIQWNGAFASSSPTALVDRIAMRESQLEAVALSSAQ